MESSEGADTGPHGPSPTRGTRPTDRGTNARPDPRSRVCAGAADDVEGRHLDGDEPEGTATEEDETGEAMASTPGLTKEGSAAQGATRRRPRPTRRHPSGPASSAHSRPRPPGANLRRRPATNNGGNPTTDAERGGGGVSGSESEPESSESRAQNLLARGAARATGQGGGNAGGRGSGPAAGG